MDTDLSIPSTTVRVTLPGIVEPSGLIVEEVPVEPPAEGELLVAVQATGISYAEQAMRHGRYFSQPKFPFTPGYDLVGTVVLARDSVLVPDAVSSEDAEAVAVNGVTAWQMLHRAACTESGQTILVFGANGGVGGILIQLALHAGVRVIGAASPRHHEALRLGGVEPVDYNDPDLAGAVRALAPGGVDAVFDNVGGATTRTSWKLLAPGGTLVSYAIAAAVSGTENLWPPFLKHISQILAWNALPNGKRATFYDLWAGHNTHQARFRQHLEEDLGQVLKLVEDGTVSANIAARFPLVDVARALTLAESRTLNGKVILLP